MMLERSWTARHVRPSRLVMRAAAAPIGCGLDFLHAAPASISALFLSALIEPAGLRWVFYSIDIMADEERPRKIAKLAKDSAQDDSVPVMTGAVGSVSDDADARNDASKPTDGNDSGAANEQEKQAETGESTPQLSKNQMKKLRRQEHWESQRELRKVKRKEYMKAKKDRVRNQWDEARKAGPEAVEKLRKERESTRHRFRKSTLLPLTLVMDCGYDDLMNDKERKSLASQITRSYSDNVRSPYRAHMIMSSFDKLLKERFETVMRKTHESWKGISFIREDFAVGAEQAKGLMQGPKGGELAGVFADKTDAKPEDGEVIYLSSDSPHTLTELKPYSTYIIGGLVDKNRHKGICYRAAEEKGIKTAKLPIGDYIQMASRKVLATNHVVEIMLKWLEVRDWGEAFMQVIPQRKGGALKDSEHDSEDPVQRGDSAEAESEDDPEEATPEEA
ncbi:tRNA (guanine(9)-N(1))-methyltransferase [Aspergillus affinis]|uniref:tRNA (guanine(9)-N(1))-methyltransferase n=1 Tax=Aspergillus affinis TaxID=1070780 RepID=UPI0022FDE56C|nr:VID27-domain-containing protein [Aspergillus affinis]KAI9045539.1 VID27-domain-containing protein [Aspergillus affinis]